MRCVCRKTIAVACLLSLATLTIAQSDLSTITGTIKDPSGSAVPNAKLIVRNEATGVERKTTASESGRFSITNLPSGMYTVTVEAAGFKKYSSHGNKLDASLPLTVDVTLEVGTMTESITVTAIASRIQSETATVGALVEEAQIKNMILNGRNPVLLASLKAGVRSNASLSNFNFNLTDGGFSMNGSRPNDNVFFYDGAVAARTRSNGTSIGAADVDAVQEVQILSANYAAEYGRSGGGQVRVITKSG